MRQIEAGIRRIKISFDPCFVSHNKILYRIRCRPYVLKGVTLTGSTPCQCVELVKLFMKTSTTIISSKRENFYVCSCLVGEVHVTKIITNGASAYLSNKNLSEKKYPRFSGACVQCITLIICWHWWLGCSQRHHSERNEV